MDGLLNETVDKSVIIANQQVELDCLRALLRKSTTANEVPQQGIPVVESKEPKIEVDVAALDHIVENATYGLLEPVTTPLGHRGPNLMPPPPPIQQPLHIEETQDSLSFPPEDEVGQLQASNSKLKTELLHWWSNTTSGSWPTSG